MQAALSELKSLPRLDGLKVLACAMRESPVRVLMLSSLTREGAEESGPRHYRRGRTGISGCR